MKATPDKLKRSMTGKGSIVFALSWISPAWAVFIGAPVIIQQAGTFVIVALLIAALIGIAMSGIAAELASAFAHAGGDITYVGKTLGPSARFAVIALLMVGNPAGQALMALTVGTMVHSLAPQLPQIPVALLAIAAAAGLAALSTQVNILVTGLFLLLELVAVMTTGALGYLHPHQDLIQVVVHPVVGRVGGGVHSPSLATMGMAMIPALGILNGYASSAGLAEEIVGVRRKLRWIILAALGIGVLVVLPPIVGVIVGAPDIARMSASQTPIQDFILETGGRGMLNLISASVALALFNTMIVTSMGSGRMLFASARDGIFHRRLNLRLASVHPRFGSPWLATLVYGAASLPFCFVPTQTLVIFGSSATAIYYALEACAVIVGRRTGATSAATCPMPLHPLGPVIVLLVAAVLFASTLADPTTGRTSLLAAFGTMLAGVLCYWVVVRPRGLWAAYHPELEDERAPT